MKSDQIIVVIPTLDNDKTIQAVVNDVIVHGYKVIVVDDGYTNPVENILNKHENLVILRHDTNLGKGEAILSGARKARELSYEYFVSIDGDGQHLASQIEKVIHSCNEKKSNCYWCAQF